MQATANREYTLHLAMTEIEAQEFTKWLITRANEQSSDKKSMGVAIAREIAKALREVVFPSEEHNEALLA